MDLGIGERDIVIDRANLDTDRKNRILETIESGVQYFVDQIGINKRIQIGIILRIESLDVWIDINALANREIATGER